MKIRLPRFIDNLKIEIQRWNFRRKYKAGDKVDIQNQMKAVEKAENISKQRKCRLWVVRLAPGKYKIYSKGDVKYILRRMGLKGKINLFENSDVVVHITK
jgi:hypothetical protein